MNDLIQKLKSCFEYSFFGVCTSIGEKFNIPSRYIRFNFVYLSLLTFGSPIIIYLTIAFGLNLRKYLKKKRNTVWEL